MCEVVTAPVGCGGVQVVLGSQSYRHLKSPIPTFGLYVCALASWCWCGLPRSRQPFPNQKQISIQNRLSKLIGHFSVQIRLVFRPYQCRSALLGNNHVTKRGHHHPDQKYCQAHCSSSCPTRDDCEYCRAILIECSRFCSKEL